MRSHMTHHDDCGCLSARYEARIATLEAELASARLDAPLAWKEVACAEGEILEALRERDEYAGQAKLYHADMMNVREQRDKAREMLAAAESLRLQGNEANARAGIALAASQAHANALRDALEEVLHNATCACYEDGEPGHCPRCAVAYQEARTALAQTPAQSLAAHDAEVLERAAAECVGRAARNAELASIWDPKDESTARKWQLRSVEASDCAGAIRALAAQEVTN